MRAPSLAALALTVLGCGSPPLPHDATKSRKGVAIVLAGRDCHRGDDCSTTAIIDLAHPAGRSSVLFAIPAGMTPDPRSASMRVELRRGGDYYPIDVAAIAAGRAPDEPLEAYDLVFIPAAPAPAKERLRDVPSPPAPVSLDGMSCGELTLRRVRVLGEGKGERHPEVLRTDAARERVCEHADPFTSLVEACRAAHRVDLLEGGSVDAELRYCASVFHGSIERATWVDCNTLRARRAELLAGGKGPRHPAVQRIENALLDCDDARP